jgi:hypothetical protein
MFLLRLFTLLSILAFAAPCFAQFSIKGQVVEAGTDEPLAFVNIVVNGSISNYTSSDIDGYFYLQSPSKIETISFSFTWYETLEVIAADAWDLFSMKVELKPSVDQLGQVTILPGENPAHRIIRNTIKNKYLNNPKKIDSYKYKSYNKVVYDMKTADSLTTEKLNKTFKGGHFMVMESVTEKKYKAPNFEEEIITGTKVSGFSSPTFGPLATDLQPFSFYEDLISIFDIDYLNPIANGSLNKYKYRIEDTILHFADTTFIISFQPKPKKNFDGLKGLLYINTNRFAVQNVIATPFEKGLIDVRIQQEYQLIDGKQWFPKELNFEFEMVSGPKDVPEGEEDFGLTISSNGKSYITNVELDVALKNRDFGIVAVKLGDKANNQDSTYWKENRHRKITNQDSTTYVVMDSLGKELKWDQLLVLSEKLGHGKLPIGFMDLDLATTLIQNQYEGYRLGIGMSTNEKISKVFSVGGFYGYGLRDERVKYGGHFDVNVNKNHEVKIKAKYFNTIDEVGQNDLNQFAISKYGIRQYMANRFTSSKGGSMELGFRVMRYFKISLAAIQSDETALFGDLFGSGPFSPVTYGLGELKIGVRFAFREKLVESLGQRLSMGSKFPVITFNYTKSERGLLNSSFSYNRYELRIEDQFKMKNLGTSKIRIDAGYIDEVLPYNFLFTGEGSQAPKRPLLIANYFQTMTPYEFVSDQYVNVFFSHDFGSLLFSTKKFKPQIIIHQNVSWGKLSGANVHQISDYKTKEKGYYEGGLQLNNLIRINYLNLGYVGLGVGAFYRYGPYASADHLSNMAFKIGVTFSTK